MKKSYALITGGSSGIGFELARCCARNNITPILLASRKKKLQKAAAQLKEEFNMKVPIITSDLTKKAAAKKIHAQCKEKKWDITILMNNAGFGNYGEFKTNDIEKETAAMKVNMIALTELTHFFLPELTKKKGKILNVSSLAAFFPGPLMAVYFATKAYVLSFSEAIRYELRDTGVTVTTLCPGPTTTDFQRRANYISHNEKKPVNMMSAERVAKEGFEGLMENKAVVIPGFKNKMATFLQRSLPREVVTEIVGKGHEVLHQDK